MKDWESISTGIDRPVPLKIIDKSQLVTNSSTEFQEISKVG